MSDYIIILGYGIALLGGLVAIARADGHARSSARGGNHGRFVACVEVRS